MTPEEIKAQGKAFDALKTVVESGIAATAEGKEKLDKINKAMDTMEASNQKLVIEIEESKKFKTEIEEKYTALETEMARLPAGSAKDNGMSMELKTFDALLKKGAGGDFSPEEQKYLRTDKGPDGGFLVNEERENFIVKQITEVSPMRQISRVRSTSSKSLLVPTRTGLVSGGWVGEGATNSEDESTYGEIEIFARKLSVNSIITIEQLQDAAYNMENEMTMDVVEDFASLEGTAFVSGAGPNQPNGFLNNADLGNTNSGVADNITGDSLIAITGTLKAGYDPVYTMNRTTIASIRQMKGGDGHYLWASGLAAGQPNTINGFRYVSMIDMPDIGAGLVPVAFGDFRRGYTVIDRNTMSVVRDEFTLATSGKVKFVFIRRVGGDVVQPEAIKTLTCAA